MKIPSKRIRALVLHEQVSTLWQLKKCKLVIQPRLLIFLQVQPLGGCLGFSSSSIWGWEFGNEVNLNTDLPGADVGLPPIVVNEGTPSTRTQADKISTEDMIVAYKEFARTIRLYDSSRIIISGNSNPRPSAYHLWKEASWTQDSVSEYYYMLDVQNPSPMSTISIHIYKSDLFSQDGNSLFFVDHKAATFKDFFQVAVNASQKLEKLLFIGEFGDSDRSIFEDIINSIEITKVPLAALWVFDYPPQEGGLNITPMNNLEYQIEEISALDKRLLFTD